MLLNSKLKKLLIIISKNKKIALIIDGLNPDKKERNKRKEKTINFYVIFSHNTFYSRIYNFTTY